MGQQLEGRSTVIKARLIDGNAVVDEGLIDLDGRGLGLARVLVSQDDVTGKELGHAGGVVLHSEGLELELKGEV
jgi:hypothetical protein